MGVVIVLLMNFWMVFFFGDFCNEYVYKWRLCYLLILVEDCLVIYLLFSLFFVGCIFKLCKGVCVKFKLNDLLDVVIYVLYVYI